MMVAHAAASSEPMVRAIETVDADWFEAGAGIIEPSGPSPDEDEWEVVGQPTDEPPDLSEAELAVLDGWTTRPSATKRSA